MVKVRAFLLENDMEKSEKNKAKDRARTAGRQWIDGHVMYKDRALGSGVTFTGKYIEVEREQPCLTESEETKSLQM